MSDESALPPDDADGEDRDTSPAQQPPPSPPPPDRGPSKLALVAVALVALLAGAGTAYALGHRGGCPGKGNALEVEGTKVSTADFAHRIDLLRALYNVRPPTDK